MPRGHLPCPHPIGEIGPRLTVGVCRTHYAANLMSATPKASWPWVKAMLHSIYDQPDAPSVHAQFDRVIEALAEKLPKVAEHLETARPDVLAFTAFPRDLWRQIWSNNPVRHEALRDRGEVEGLPRWAVAAA